MTNNTTLVERLKPCPFCGSQAGRAHDITLKWIFCAYGCGAEGPKVSGVGNKDEAALWNTRAGETACR